MSWKRNKKVKVLVMLIAAIAIIHFGMPPLLNFYVNRTLQNLPGYSPRIERVRVNFFRAAYTIDSLTIYASNGSSKVTFVTIPKIAVSLQWESLLVGELVTKIQFDNPSVNFLAENANGDAPWDLDWSVPIRKLSFLPINQVRVKDGMIGFYDLRADPPVDVFLRNLDVEVHNLNNARDDGDLLPARIYAQAHSSGNGSLSLVMKVNARKPQPDLDMDLKFENVNLQSLRGFLTAYANVDVLKGNFNLYSEVTVLNGKVDGYVKPQLDNFLLNGRTQPLRVLMGDGPQMLDDKSSTNNGTQLITRIPLDGEIAGRTSRFWPKLWNIFRNASVEGIERNTKDAAIIASAQ